MFCFFAKLHTRHSWSCYYTVAPGASTNDHFHQITFISQDKLIFSINQNKIQSPGSYLQMSCVLLFCGAFTGLVLPRDVITRFYTIPQWLITAEVLQLKSLQLEKKPGRTSDINTHSDPTGRRTHPTTSICILNIPYPRESVVEQHRPSVI